MKPAKTTGAGNYQQRNRFWRLRARRSGNPLLRRWTPLERLAALAVAVLASALVTATTLAACFSFAATQRSARMTHLVTAMVVSTEAADPSVAQPEVGGMGTFTAHLRWNWRGANRNTDVPVMMPPPNGATMRIRVDDAGEPVSDPWSTGNPVLALSGTIVAGVLFTLVLAVAAIAALRQWVFQRRAKWWQAEWERVAPLWTGQ